MILEGSVKIKAPIDKLYDFVMNPESIMGCLRREDEVHYAAYQHGEADVYEL